MLQNASILIGQQGVSCSLYWLTKVRKIYEPSCLLFNVAARYWIQAEGWGSIDTGTQLSVVHFNCCVLGPYCMFLSVLEVFR